MNTKELSLLAATAPLDDGQTFTPVFSIALLDANNQVVTKTRQDMVAMHREPIDKKEQQAVYDDPDMAGFWHKRYPTFDDFYAFMDSARLVENKLVDEATFVALLHPSYTQM